jgi:hypothetical protein
MRRCRGRVSCEKEITNYSALSDLFVLIRSWENADASEASFTSKNRLQLLRALLSHPRISLFTLNSPQSALKGVTPLGMASWLNIPEVVCTLLEDSAEAVSVDGMDSYGATALMCASSMKGYYD